MQLLERTNLIKELEEDVAGAVGGAGRLVLLVGEAGAGKTSIAQVIAKHAEPAARVLWGACEDLSTPSPLVSLLDIAREGGWRLPPAEDSASRVALFETAFGLLSSEPTLAVFEDLHWADDATLDFLRFAGRRIRKAPLLILATARDDSSETPGRLRRALADVPTENYRRAQLPRLTREAVFELSSNHGRDGSAVYALTSGNPFLTLEVLRHGSDLPTTVRDALLWRADKLSPTARMVLDAASVFPRRVERDVLGKMVDGGGEEVAISVAGGLLQVEGGFCFFRHEIARRAVEAALADSLRVRLNQLALEILRAANAKPTARLVHHAIEAQDVSAIAELAPAAGAEAAAAEAHREAARHFSAALQYVDSWDNSRRAALHENLGSELELAGDLRGAIQAFEAALELRQQEPNHLRVADILIRLAALYPNIGLRARGEEVGKQAIDVLKPLGETHGLAMAYARRAHMLAMNDDIDNAIELANGAIPLAQKLDRPEVLADAYAALGLAYKWQDSSVSRQHYATALKFALDCNRPNLVARIHINSGSAELNRRANAAARQKLTEGLRYATKHDLAFWETYSKGLLAELIGREGDWVESERLAREALEAAGETLTMRFPASAALCRILIRRGDDAADLLENLAFDAQPQRLVYYAPLLGERAWMSGDGVEAALDVLRQAAMVAAQVGNSWAAGEIEYWRSKLTDDKPSRDLKAAEPFALLFAEDWSAAANAWKDLNCPFERALALLEGPAAACDQGLDMLEQLGAFATASRARQNLRARGLRGLKRGPRALTRSNAAGLTLREAEVLNLLAGGGSNNDIAARLDLASKTIAHHVSAILTKLEVASRLEAVAKARQLGMLDD